MKKFLLTIGFLTSFGSVGFCATTAAKSAADIIMSQCTQEFCTNHNTNSSLVRAAFLENQHMWSWNSREEPALEMAKRVLGDIGDLLDAQVSKSSALSVTVYKPYSESNKVAAKTMVTVLRDNLRKFFRAEFTSFGERVTGTGNGVNIEKGKKAILEENIRVVSKDLKTKIKRPEKKYKEILVAEAQTLTGMADELQDKSCNIGSVAKRYFALYPTEAAKKAAQKASKDEKK